MFEDQRGRHSMARRRILIVDDDERVLFVLHHALVRLSREYDVMTARNAHEALDEIKKMPFDLKPVEVDEIRQVVREALTSEKQDGMEGAPK